MYKWKLKQIKQLINYLNSLDNNLNIVKEDILTLEDIIYDIKHFYSRTYTEIKENMFDENEDYEELKSYNDIISKISTKYFEKPMLELFKYKTILYKEDNLIDFTRDNIKNININWYNTLSPYLNKTYLKTYLDFKKNSTNSTIFIEYLNKFYISFEKSNTIADFITPTHEFLHIYSIILNNNFINNIESEFLSILGELITSYEMKKKFIFNREIIKNDIETYTIILSFIKAIAYKKLTINDNIDSENKFKYLKNEIKLNKKDIKDMYKTPLEYNYNFVISYFIALELFEIYIHDKEKCFYICDNIIKSNKDLKTKLNNNNITLLTNDESYIKTLKKEYAILNNQ